MIFHGLYASLNLSVLEMAKCAGHPWAQSPEKGNLVNKFCGVKNFDVRTTRTYVVIV